MGLRARTCIPFQVVLDVHLLAAVAREGGTQAGECAGGHMPLQLLRVDGVVLAVPAAGVQQRSSQRLARCLLCISDLHPASEASKSVR